MRNPAGNVVGLMPHPEHAVDPDVGPTGGQPLFASLFEATLGGRPLRDEPLHRQLGLRDDEHERIVATLGREPTAPNSRCIR